MKKIVLILSTVLFCLESFAQEQEKPLHYWRKTNELLADQAEYTFQLVNQILKENPPTSEESLIRKSALLHLDCAFHDTRLDDSEPFYRFMEYRIQQIINDLDNPVSEGMKIYKLYNHAFIVKTKNFTIAFDIYRGEKKDSKPYISNELIKAMAERSDIMFVSHAHSDHADWQVAEIFIKAGKNIIAPTGLWENNSNLIRHMRSDNIINEKIRLSSGKRLQVKVMPGHQDKDPNNIYIVTTPEGISVAHTGDQWNKDDDKWIAKIHEDTPVDVLLVHCWAMPLENIIGGFNPKIVVTGHENEMAHSIDHREPYWLNHHRLEKVTLPVVTMAWGEHYLYKQNN